jgi:TM2 domain-containing membrane protein YozV
MPMPLSNPLYTSNMNDHQRAWFYAEYEQARKDEAVGLLLALFLGGFGIHRFYLRQNTAGVIYLLFCWTGITTIIGFIECFFMPERVRIYNAGQASYIASGILSTPTLPGSAPPPAPNSQTVTRCNTCGEDLAPAAAFCPHCGAAIVREAPALPAL